MVDSLLPFLPLLALRPSSRCSNHFPRIRTLSYSMHLSTLVDSLLSGYYNGTNRTIREAFPIAISGFWMTWAGTHPCHAPVEHSFAMSF